MGAAHWYIAPEWKGERCYIVGGGPSAGALALDRLAGRKVIAINSSYLAVPFADVLWFADSRWWRVHKDRAEFKQFAGRMVTCAPDQNVADDRIWRLRRTNAFGIEPNHVMMRRTGMTAAMNMAAHLGVARIVAIGLDGQPGPDGRTHHHEPHPWGQKQGCWAEQAADLVQLVEPLAERGIVVVNASPGSAVDFWPIVNLEGEL